MESLDSYKWELEDKDYSDYIFIIDKDNPWFEIRIPKSSHNEYKYEKTIASFILWALNQRGENGFFSKTT